MKDANAQVGTSATIEANEKTVNTIYLSTVAKDIDAFTTTEVSQLFDVANQCPLLGGNAVYRARSLYALIDDAQDFDDPALCLAHGIIVRSLEERNERTVQVLPNPANDEATLVYQFEEGHTGYLVLQDAVGKEVLRHALTADLSRFSFSTVSLAPGAYHYVVLEGDGLLGEGKLVVVH